MERPRRTATAERKPLSVVLVRPPQRTTRTSHLRIAVPPLSIAYLGAALLAKGIRVAAVDCVGEAPFQMRPLGSRFLRYGLTDDELVARIPPDTDIIGVNCMFSEEWPLLRHTLQVLRRAFPSALVVAGGEHITALPEHSLRDSRAIDLCVLGEGEDTLVDIAETVGRGEDPRRVTGVAYLENDTFRTTGRRPRIGELDRLPHPAWHLLPIENYLRHGFKYGLGEGRTIPLMVSRGCPFSCTFCSSPQMWTTRWVARDPDDVLEEMAFAIETFGAENFDLYDLTAIIKREWIVEFATKLIERQWKVTWQLPSGTRSEVLDDEVLSLIKRSGCSYLPYAPESGSPDLLRRIKKRVRLDNMKRSIRSAVRAGLHVKCNIVMGFPDETRGDMWKTVKFCAHAALLGVNDIHVLAFCPYPGSELHAQFVRSGRIPRIDDAYFDKLAAMAELSVGEHWCDNVSARELFAMRMTTLAVFYSISLATHPTRLFQLVGDFATGRNGSRLARALRQLAQRTLFPKSLGTRPAAPVGVAPNGAVGMESPKNGALGSGSLTNGALGIGSPAGSPRRTTASVAGTSGGPTSPPVPLGVPRDAPAEPAEAKARGR